MSTLVNVYNKRLFNITLLPLYRPAIHTAACFNQLEMSFVGFCGAFVGFSIIAGLIANVLIIVCPCERRTVQYNHPVSILDLKQNAILYNVIIQTIIQ